MKKKQAFSIYFNFRPQKHPSSLTIKYSSVDFTDQSAYSVILHLAFLLPESLNSKWKNLLHASSCSNRTEAIRLPFAVADNQASTVRPTSHSHLPVNHHSCPTPSRNNPLRMRFKLVCDQLILFLVYFFAVDVMVTCFLLVIIFMCFPHSNISHKSPSLNKSPVQLNAHSKTFNFN